MPEWVRPELPARTPKRASPSSIATRRGGRSRTRRAERRGRHTHRFRQNAVLQPAGSERRARESGHAGAVPVPDQGARAGPARRTARSFGERLDNRFGVFTYDGDTPSDARNAIRERGHIVLTNPDMLHTGILPHHTRWKRLFENLRYIVLDELHTYRGVFGSHLANVLRRLRRVARFLRLEPQFICCSATIANPGELAARLTETKFDVIEENGAPSGEKFFVFYNPPVVNRFLGIRRGYIGEASRLAQEFLKRGLQTLVFAN